MDKKDKKVVTGKVRFSYANVWEPKSINGGDEKYSVSIIIPKSDKLTLAKVKAAIEAAKKEGASKFGEKALNNFRLPLRDGDAERAEDEAYENSYFINVSSTVKPNIVDKNLVPITDSAEFYSGCCGRASIVFYAYNNNESRGIGCILHNLQKLEDGEHLTGRSSADEDFGTLEDDILS